MGQTDMETAATTITQTPSQRSLGMPWKPRRRAGEGQEAQVCSLTLLRGENHHPGGRLSLEMSAAKWRKRPCAQLLRCLSWQLKCLLWEPSINARVFPKHFFCAGGKKGSSHTLNMPMVRWPADDQVYKEQGGILDPSHLSLTSNPWPTVSAQPLKQILFYFLFFVHAAQLVVS